MRIIYALVMVLLVISVYAVSSFAQETAEVRYTCDKGTIEIHLSEVDKCLEGARDLWSGIVVPWEQTQYIETVNDTSLGERYFRKLGKPVKYECTLKSGKYTVSFGSHWVNHNVGGMDGMDIWPTVKITRDKETILPTTVLGICDMSRSVLGDCRNEWAISIFIFDYQDKPSVIVNRFVKDNIR